MTNPELYTFYPDMLQLVQSVTICIYVLAAAAQHKPYLPVCTAIYMCVQLHEAVKPIVACDTCCPGTCSAGSWALPVSKHCTTAIWLLYLSFMISAKLNAISYLTPVQHSLNILAQHTHAVQMSDALLQMRRAVQFLLTTLL
jgi:hypothetical protein